VFGRDAETALGGLVATTPGESDGVGGLGLFGPHLGGGGTGERTIRLTTLGTVRTAPPGRSPPGDRPGLRRLPSHKPPAALGTPTPQVAVKGSLDRDIVRRVVRSHMNEVRFCYEKELMKRPDLNGRVMTQFTISATGQVITAGVERSTLNAPEVE